MKEERKNRTELLQVRVTPEEMKQFKTRLSQSTCRKKSDYIRRLLVDQPVRVRYYNQSLEDFMQEMMRLRTELHQSNANFESIIKRLNILNKDEDYKGWLILYEMSRKTLLQNVNMIKQKIAQISDKWLR